MSDKIFIDTNVLVYAYTSGDIEKHEAAKHFLQYSNNALVISTQVLNEFYNALSKFKIKHDVIVSIITEISNFCDVKSVELKTVKTALALKKRYDFSYWDCLVLSAALENDCKKIISEDMQDEQIIENSLKITNIFK